MTSFDAFLEKAWADHGECPEEVAQRLEQGYTLIETPAQIAPFARILAHVDGEHLARWRGGAERLERLRTHAQWRADGDAPTIVRRLVAAMHFGNGHEPAESLDRAERAHAHAVVAAALAAQDDLQGAIGHFRNALVDASPGLEDGEPAIRALAVTSNNLAATLEEKRMRSADETAAMVDAAKAAREYWARAGGWLETERAEYMLAKCLLAAGNPEDALLHAKRCAAICDANDADAFERFFAQGRLAAVHRALGDDRCATQARTAALALYAALPAEQKKGCDEMLRELRS